MKNETRSNFASVLDEYEESCVHLRGFAALLDRDREIFDESRDEVSALLSHLMRSHFEKIKKLITAVEVQSRTVLT